MVQQFKGETKKKIVFGQFGNSKGTVKWGARYKYGDEVLLFMRHCPRGSEDDVGYDNAYRGVGSYSTALPIVRNKAGKAFYIDPLGMIGSEMVKDIENHAISDYVLRKELWDKHVEKFPSLAEELPESVHNVPVGAFEFIFAKDDIDSYLRSLEEKQG